MCINLVIRDSLIGQITHIANGESHPGKPQKGVEYYTTGQYTDDPVTHYAGTFRVPEWNYDFGMKETFYLSRG